VLVRNSCRKKIRCQSMNPKVAADRCVHSPLITDRETRRTNASLLRYSVNNSAFYVWFHAAHVTWYGAAGHCVERSHKFHLEVDVLLELTVGYAQTPSDLAGSDTIPFSVANPDQASA